MASEMRVACVLCASHPCVRGGLRRPLPSCWPRAIGRACRLWGVARGTAWRGAERVRGSLVAPVRRERPWARFHKHNHPPKRSHCHIRQTRSTNCVHDRRPPGRRPPTRPGRRRARAREPPRNRCSAHPHRGRPLADGNTRAARARVTHLRLTLQLGLVHRRVYRTQPTGAHENVRVPVPADRPRTNAPDVTANPTQAARRVPRPKDTRRAVAGSRVGPSGPQLLRTDP